MSSPLDVERPPSFENQNPVLQKPKVKFKEKNDVILSDETNTNVSSRTSTMRLFVRRKRTKSFPLPLDQKRRRTVLPTKFLLGGNIHDPLNLEALDKGDKSSDENSRFDPPVRRNGQVPVIIPPNINDPLNLDANSDDGNEQLARAIAKQRAKKRGKQLFGVPVIIPPNINDPLNLDANSDDGNEQLARAIAKQRAKKRGKTGLKKPVIFFGESKRKCSNKFNLAYISKRRRRNSEPINTKCDADGTGEESRKNARLKKNCISLTNLSPAHTQPTLGDLEPLEKSCGLEEFSENLRISNRNNKDVSKKLCSNSVNKSEELGENKRLEVLRENKRLFINNARDRNKERPVTLPKLFFNFRDRKKFRRRDDKIVSPVIPQPGVERRRSANYQRQFSGEDNKRRSLDDTNARRKILVLESSSIHSTNLSVSSDQSRSQLSGKKESAERPLENKSEVETFVQPGCSNENTTNKNLDRRKITFQQEFTQPGPSKQPKPSNQKPGPSNQKPGPSKPNFKPKNALFRYGNYNQYYGYRNTLNKTDIRLKVLNQEWFNNKKVLDIGCNIGHVTLMIARDFFPKSVIGIDIDKKLVKIAEKNIKHYKIENNEFPVSTKFLGPLQSPLDGSGRKKFPHNVKFCQSNYVLDNDALLDTVRPEYDVILCLSVTKWIHLNFGDAGLKRFFRRIFLNLLPDGILVLEPQAWPSYKQKKKLTETIFENFKTIQLRPEKFNDYLTRELDFVLRSKHSVHHTSKGFDRPIYVFQKPSQKVQTDESLNLQKISDSSQNPNVSDITQTPKTADLLKITDSSQNSKDSDITQTLKTADLPKSSKKANVSDITPTPRTADLPKIADSSQNPNYSDITQTPQTADLPKIYDSSQNPNDSDITQAPKTADLPKIPDSLPNLNDSDITQAPKNADLPKSSKNVNVPTKFDVTETISTNFDVSETVDSFDGTETSKNVVNPCISSSASETETETTNFPNSSETFVTPDIPQSLENFDLLDKSNVETVEKTGFPKNCSVEEVVEKSDFQESNVQEIMEKSVQQFNVAKIVKKSDLQQCNVAELVEKSDSQQCNVAELVKKSDSKQCNVAEVVKKPNLQQCNVAEVVEKSDSQQCNVAEVVEKSDSRQCNVEEVGEKSDLQHCNVVKNVEKSDLQQNVAEIVKISDSQQCNVAEIVEKSHLQ